MAERWVQREGVPFVFAKFCYNRHGEFYTRIARKFVSQKVFIPRYLLEQYAHKTQIPAREILHYLRHISYRIDPKAAQGVKRFYRQLDELRLKAPRRF